MVSGQRSSQQQFLYLNGLSSNRIKIEGEPRNIMAGTAIESGANHILIFAGAKGELLKKECR